jgi:hypothetical protein
MSTIFFLQIWHIFVEDFKIIISVNFESGVQLSFYHTYIWLFSLETYCFKSTAKISHFIYIGQKKTWPPFSISVSDWLKL